MYIIFRERHVPRERSSLRQRAKDAQSWYHTTQGPRHISRPVVKTTNCERVCEILLGSYRFCPRMLATPQEATDHLMNHGQDHDSWKVQWSFLRAWKAWIYDLAHWSMTMVPLTDHREGRGVWHHAA